MDLAIIDWSIKNYNYPGVHSIGVIDLYEVVELGKIRNLSFGISDF